MRPTAARHLVAGLLGALALSALLLAGLQRAQAAGTLSVLPIRWLLVSVADLMCPPAAAQQTLQFRPVPAESASRFERLRVRRAAGDASSVEAAPATPESPADPPATPAPSRPEIVIGKSGSVMRIGSDIHVGEGEVIRGDLNTVGGDITIDGHVQGNVVAMRGDVTLSSTARVDGDVVCIGGMLREAPGAVVGGERVTAGDDRRGRDDGDDDEDRSESRSHRRDGGRVMSKVITLLLALGAAWGLSRFASGRTRAAVETMRREPGVSLGVGALVWALVVPSIVALALVVALLCITIIGIPLALAALLGYALFLCVLMVWGYVVGAAVLGGAAAQRQASRAAAMAPGAVPPAPLPGTTVSPSAEIERSALLGVGILGGAGVLSALLRLTDGPLHALGTLIAVIAFIATVVLTTVGAGAWLRSEFATGLLGRWWSGRRNRGFGGAPPPPSPAPVPPGPTPAGGVAPAASVPSSPAAYAPPAAPGVAPPPAGGAWPPPATPVDPARYAPPLDPSVPPPSRPETPGSTGS